jgi:hypothetical protein
MLTRFYVARKVHLIAKKKEKKKKEKKKFLLRYQLQHFKFDVPHHLKNMSIIYALC